MNNLIINIFNQDVVNARKLADNIAKDCFDFGKVDKLKQIEQERRAFEEFMRSQNDDDRLELDADGSYADISIDYAWAGWKARAKADIDDASQR